MESTMSDAVAILYEKMLLVLFERLKDNEATPSDFKLIRDLAKDHQIELNVPTGNSKLGEIYNFPFQTAGEDVNKIMEAVADVG